MILQTKKFAPRLLLLTFIFFQVSKILISQSLDLTQNTNYYISKSSEDLIFISSMEGLNIYDGSETRVYKLSSHNMYGKNIQSEFYEDSNKNVWFCTFQALHYYDPLLDDFEYFFLKDSVGRDIKADYRIIGLHENLLWVHTSNEIHAWDVITNKTIYRYYSPANSIVHSAYGTDMSHILLLSLDNVFYYEINNANNPNWHLLPISFCSSAHYDKAKRGYYIGNSEGKLEFFDIQTKSIQFETKIFDQPLRHISSLQGDSIALTSPDLILYYDKRLDRVIGQYTPPQPECVIRKNYSTFKSYDDILWISNEGVGVNFHTDVSKRRIKHKLQLGDQTFPSLTGIYELNEKYVYTSRGSGIIISDKDHNIIDHINQKDKLFILSGVTESRHTLLLNIESTLYRFDIRDKSLFKLENQSNHKPQFTPSIIKLGPNEYLSSTYNNLLHKIIVDKNNYRYHPIENVKFDTETTTYINSINEHKYIVSDNDQSLALLFATQDSIYTRSKIDMKGGVLCSYMMNDTIALIGNREGLYKLNILSSEYSQLIDDKRLLDQTIYSVYADTRGYLWCSSNKGILRYNPTTNEGHQFSRDDGAQADEFNSHAHLQLQDGRIMMGGIFGLNYFYPDSISLLEKEASIRITNYRINDEDSDKFGVPNLLNSMKLNYDNNTLAFHLHAVDYCNPLATRIKYKLTGVDKNYVESTSSKGEIRYPNLDPGSYILCLKGANSDGVWNTSERTINITIKPPYWQTLWFRMLAVASIGSIVFFIFRYYYRQQLARKDFELREQALIIEKQNALQAERTRIAGEMHDDLGGGLTTIRFLSQKVIRGDEDSKKNKDLTKIVQQSRSLINNMSEIIWAMNAGFDTLDNLIAYSRIKAYEFLEPHSIDLKFNIQGEFTEIELSGEKRRNIFLVIKEALHNIVKHSQADLCSISFLFDKKLKIIISDNGKGLFTDQNSLGNGLKNMKERITHLGGGIDFESDIHGFQITITIPINSD